MAGDLERYFISPPVTSEWSANITKTARPVQGIDIFRKFALLMSPPFTQIGPIGGTRPK